MASFAFSEVESKFIFPYAINVAYTAFLLLSTVCVGVSLYRAISHHTGLFWESAYITHNRKTANEKIRQKSLSIIFTVAFSLLSVFNLYTYGCLYKRPILNTLAAAAGVLLSVCASLFYTTVKSSVLEKYSTENKMN
jgi:hypothetical protein